MRNTSPFRLKIFLLVKRIEFTKWGVVHRGGPWTGSMKGSMDWVHRGGPWTWGPCFVYILLCETRLTPHYSGHSWLRFAFTFEVTLNMRLRTTSGQSTSSVVLGLLGKTTDFLSNYLLLLPVQYVIMTYYSSTLVYINGIQVSYLSF